MRVEAEHEIALAAHGGELDAAPAPGRGDKERTDLAPRELLAGERLGEELELPRAIMLAIEMLERAAAAAAEMAAGRGADAPLPRQGVRRRGRRNRPGAAHPSRRLSRYRRARKGDESRSPPSRLGPVRPPRAPISSIATSSSSLMPARRGQAGMRLELEVAIEEIGARGGRIASLEGGERLYVPFTLPGDRVLGSAWVSAAPGRLRRPRRRTPCRGSGASAPGLPPFRQLRRLRAPASRWRALPRVEARAPRQVARPPAARGVRDSARSL